MSWLPNDQFWPNNFGLNQITPNTYAAIVPRASAAQFMSENPSDVPLGDYVSVASSASRIFSNHPDCCHRFHVQKTEVSGGNMCAAVNAVKSKRECTVVDGIWADPGKDDAIM